MNRLSAGLLFVLASIIGGLVLFNAASIAVVNLVRGALLLLRAFFSDANDFSYLVHAVPFAIAVAVMYGIVRGLRWLAAKTVSGPPTLDAPENSSVLMLRARSWTIVLTSLLIIAVAFNISLTIWLYQQDPDAIISGFLNGEGNRWMSLIIASGAYMPFAVAAHAMASVGLELSIAENSKKVWLWAGWLLPPVVLIGWLISQGVTGGLF